KIEELSNEAYFSKNNEFAAWLKEETKLFFSDLSSEHARELFSDFIKDWNDLKSLNRDTMRASQVVLGVLITGYSKSSSIEATISISNMKRHRVLTLTTSRSIDRIL
ncbi:hypothetical protein Tsubulata_013146, partial [Turnera subulata]